MVELLSLVLLILKKGEEKCAKEQGENFRKERVFMACLSTESFIQQIVNQHCRFKHLQ